jgi:2-amino-4-hydroxy-6-hydroxymethyldihydropteridine diphosphokinase
MATCLIALGSNLGDREATLESALAALDEIPSSRVLRHSRWHCSSPIGIDSSNHEFLNGAALIDTSLEPQVLLERLQQIESAHGRRREQRWIDRTLDLDLLLYDELVLDTPTLIIPHPRMSFRRFVLEPAAEIAGSMRHPAIGWSIEQLIHRLQSGADLAAVLSPGGADRRRLAESLSQRFDAQITDPPHSMESETLWPRSLAAWLQMGGGSAMSKDPKVADGFPKLTILWDGVLEGSSENRAAWDAIVRQPGRGPTLRIRAQDSAEAEQDAAAAVQAVWPHLGP